MKLPEIKHVKWNYCALAFVIPTISMLILMLIRVLGV